MTPMSLRVTLTDNGPSYTRAREGPISRRKAVGPAAAAATGPRSCVAVDLGRGVDHSSRRRMHLRGHRARCGITGAGTPRRLCAENGPCRVAPAVASGGRGGRSNRLSEGIARAPRTGATPPGGGGTSCEGTRCALRTRGNGSNLGDYSAEAVCRAISNSATAHPNCAGLQREVLAVSSSMVFASSGVTFSTVWRITVGYFSVPAQTAR
jgi:hypothetical protein